MAETGFKYRAFISYSHADHDWAAWLHRALERYRVPKQLAGAERVNRLGKCFRDEEELSAAAELGPKIADALKASDALIVVCSPRSAKSQWVNQEIVAFKQSGREGRVFALIVDGEPHGLGDTDCFPPALKITTAGGVAEPLAVDVRKFGRDDAVLRLVGGILDVGYDELRRREARKRRNEMLRAQALFVSGLVLVAAALAGGYVAASNYVDASEQKSALFAAAADQLTAGDSHLSATLLALHGDMAAEAGWLEGLFRPNGYAGRDALVRAYTHRRLVGYFGDEGVSAMAASHDAGGIVVLGHKDGSVNIWSAHGKKLKVLAEPGTAEVVVVGLSADQRVIAAGNKAGGVRVWEVASGREMASFATEQESMVRRVAVSPDGRQVATVGFNLAAGEIKLWAAEGGALQHVLQGKDGYVWEIAYSRDGRQLVAATGQELIETWDPETGAKNDLSLTFDRKITSFALMEDPDAIAVGVENGSVYVRGIVNEDWLFVRPYGDSVESVDVSPLDNSVLSTDSRGSARIHETFLQEQRAVLIGEVGSANFIDGGRRVLTRTGSNRVQLWNAFRGRAVWDFETPSLEQVAVSSDGSMFAVLGGGHVKAWSLKTGKLLRDAPYGETYADLRVAEDGSEIVAVSVAGTVTRWRMGGATQVNPPGAWFNGEVVPDATGTTLLTGFGGGDAVQWSTLEGKVVATYPSEGRRAAGGIFAAKAPVVLIGYQDGSNTLWSTQTQAKLMTFPADLFSLEVRLSISVALSPDGSLVAAGLVDGTIWLFSTATGEKVATLIDHSDHITAMAFSPDSKLLVSASGDGTAKLWNVNGALPLETFEPLDRDLLDIAFTPDGRRILAGSKKLITLWDIDPIVFAPAKAQVTMACEKLKALEFSEFETDTEEAFPIIGRLGRNACAESSRWLAPAN